MSQKRTSKEQLKWLFGGIWRILRAIGRHIKRFGLGYGFLGGIASTLLVIAAVIWYGLLAYPLPWKVIDPTDPRFDPMKFEFTDYMYHQNLRMAINCMFPVGTDKVYVDQILGNIGGAKNKKYKSKNKESYHPNEYRYERSIFRRNLGHFIYSMFPSGPISISMQFDPFNKVEDGFYITPCKKGGIKEYKEKRKKDRKKDREFKKTLSRAYGVKYL